MSVHFGGDTLFLSIWYFLFGYAKIKATGFGTERMLNMLTYKKVYIWEVTWQGVGVCLKLPRKDVAILEGVCERVGCHLEYVEYGGLPHILSRFRGREVLGFGCLFFAAMLYVLSSFIWVVSVEGNERIATEEILDYCGELGLSPASQKKGISTEDITKKLLVAFPDISWVSVGIDGTDATIKIAETIEKVEVVDRETPTDIVATKDGVVLQITAERGTPLVAMGDVVKEGQVLISSVVTLGLEGEEQWEESVYAKGSITARTWQYDTEELPLAYKEQVETGAVADNFVLYIGGAKVDAIQPDVKDTYEVVPVYTRFLSLGDFDFPVGIAKESYVSYIVEEKIMTLEEAKEKIHEKITKKAENILQSRGTIEMMDILYTESEDCVIGEATIVTIEEIGAEAEAIALGEKGWDAGANGTNGESDAVGQ